MDTHFHARLETYPEAMMAVAAHVEREYGYGYRIGVAHTETPVAVFEVSACDGSRFNLVADRWGNVQEIPEDATRLEAIHQVMEMRSAALAS